MKVGLTGAIASGKSTVAGVFAALGAHVIQADRIAHELMLPGKPVYEEVVAHFGNGILAPDGAIDRARLAELAFSTSGGQPRIGELNAIVHPAVIAAQNRWMDDILRADPAAIAMVEAALLLEAGMKACFDKIIVVTCTPAQRVERWMLRTSVDRDTAEREVARRMAAQMPEEDKIREADYVIDNSGTAADARVQVERIMRAFAG